MGRGCVHLRKPMTMCWALVSSSKRRSSTASVGGMRVLPVIVLCDGQPGCCSLIYVQAMASPTTQGMEAGVPTAVLAKAGVQSVRWFQGVPHVNTPKTM